VVIQVLIQINHEKSLFKTIKNGNSSFWTHYQVKTTRTFGYLWKHLWQECTRTSQKNVPGPAQGLAEFKYCRSLAASLWSKKLEDCLHIGPYAWFRQWTFMMMIRKFHTGPAKMLPETANYSN